LHSQFLHIFRLEHFCSNENIHLNVYHKRIILIASTLFYLFVYNEVKSEQFFIIFLSLSLSLFRELKHKNVVNYYGVALKEEGGKGKHSKVSWIMVMEYCTDTLKSVFLDQEFDNPGKLAVYSAQFVAMENMARTVIQICEGLAYLHSIDLVHRDMKLENILVCTNNILNSVFDIGRFEKCFH